MAAPPWNLRYAAHLGLRAPDAPLFASLAGSNDPAEQVGFVAALGFAGIQDNFLNVRPPAEQERIGAAIARHGLEMGSFVCSVEHWRSLRWGSADPAALDAIRSDVRASIEAARRVGGRCVTVTGGRDPALPLAAQHARMIDKLRRVADLAAAGGIVLTIEATDEGFLPGMLVHRAADALAIVRAVDHPSVRLVFDVGHVQGSEGTVLPALRDSWEQVANLQVADHPGRVDPGCGSVDWRALLGFLHERGYRGLLELELLPIEPGAAGERALLARLEALDTAAAAAARR